MTERSPINMTATMNDTPEPAQTARPDRDPAAKICPLDKITSLDWKWSEDPKENARLQQAHGEKMVKDWNVESLQSCSACHR